MGNESISMVVNINPSKLMFDETHHVLNFSAIAKDIICEEQPKEAFLPVKRNRFSEYLERQTAVIPPIVEEDTIRFELEELRNINANLLSEFEAYKIDAEYKYESERKRLINGYKELMRDKEKESERRLEELRTHYENKIKNIQEKHEYESERVTYILDDDEEHLIEDYKEKLRESNEEVSKLKGCLDDAVKDYQLLTRKCNELSKTVRELKSENIALKEQLNEELEYSMLLQQQRGPSPESDVAEEAPEIEENTEISENF